MSSDDGRRGVSFSKAKAASSAHRASHVHNSVESRSFDGRSPKLADQPRDDEMLVAAAICPRAISRVRASKS